MENKEQPAMIPIWFFIGINVLLYGVIIAGSGLIHWSNPPASVAMTNLHPDVWWGAFMTVIGLVYTVRYWPTKIKEEPRPDTNATGGIKRD